MKKMEKRATGGTVDKDDAPEEVYAGKGSNVEKEAKSKFKRGGAVKKLGNVMGARSAPRLDKPGRKSGGGVGANRTPLSTANKLTEAVERSDPD